jgi:hypothetical protein
VRLSVAEREALTARADGAPLSTYVKEVLFAPDAPVRRAHRSVSMDREIAGRILAALGASRIASNLSQIAKHANLGNLYFDDEVKSDIREGCEHLRNIRALLLEALGKEPARQSPHQALARSFNKASSHKGDAR